LIVLHEECGYRAVAYADLMLMFSGGS